MTVANVHEAAHLIAWEAEPQGIEWNSNSFRPWQRVAETHQPLSQASIISIFPIHPNSKQYLKLLLRSYIRHPHDYIDLIFGCRFIIEDTITRHSLIGMAMMAGSLRRIV